jgi:predicted Ser/Thr protein kinase
MHNTMLGLFNLGGGEIILILFILMLMGAGAVAVVLVVLWLFAKQRNPPPAVPPVQPTKPVPPPRTCPRCGAPLTASAPEGLCPRCVLGVGLATHTDAPGEFGASDTKVPQPPLPPGEIAKHFPQLEIIECLGRGGMGVVYLARQEKLNRLVALKILAPEKGADPKFAERFLREAQALARLSHPNIVTVHDFGEADGLYYLLMEYVDGVTLRQLLQAHRMAPEEALRIVPKICDALQYAHEQGVVHRDIKPENVLLDKQGRVKIADFGIAKLVGAEDTRQTLTEQQSVIGTPHYMAPEQVERPQLVDHRADIYSLGVVFYEMLTGELPLGNFQPPSKKVQVDVRLDEVVLHALEKEPERRYQHASEVKTAVETIATTPERGNEAEPIRVRVLRWRDLWIWDTSNVIALALVPMVLSFSMTGVLLPFWGKWALLFLLLWAAGLAFAAMYAFVGAKVRKLKTALPRPTGEVAEALMFRRPFQSPGLAVLHSDRLELIWITGTSITVRLEDITALTEVRWFNGTRLWWKKGFVLELANGQRVGVAVAEVFARRWRARLSRGSLPEIGADSESAAAVSQARVAERAAVGAPRFSRAAIWGAVWAPLFFTAAVPSLMVVQVSVAAGSPPPGAAWWQVLLSLTLLPLGAAAPFGTTILGWIAVAQIRHSGGRQYGLGLAMFDGLLFPLLALDGLVSWLCGRCLGAIASRWIYPHITHDSMWNYLDPWGIALLIVAVVVVLDVWIVQLILHRANRPPDNGQIPFPPATASAAPASRPGNA